MISCTSCHLSEFWEATSLATNITKTPQETLVDPNVSKITQRLTGTASSSDSSWPASTQDLMVQQNKHLTPLAWIKNKKHLHQCDFKEIKMIWISIHIYTRTAVSRKHLRFPAITNHRTLVELVILVHFFCLLISEGVCGRRCTVSQFHPDFPGRSLDINQRSQVTLILLKFDMRWWEIGMLNGIQQCLRDIDCRCIHGKIVSKVKVLLLLTCFACCNKTTSSTWYTLTVPLQTAIYRFKNGDFSRISPLHHWESFHLADKICRKWGSIQAHLPTVPSGVSSRDAA